MQLNDDDQKMYNRFNVVVSDRWQAEMMGRCGLVLLLHPHILFINYYCYRECV